MNDFRASSLPLKKFYRQVHIPEVRARCFSAACLAVRRDQKVIERKRGCSRGEEETREGGRDRS